MTQTTKTEFIYILTESDGKPKYCGHSIDPTKRLQQHLDEAIAGGKSLKCGWIRAVLAEGGEVLLKVVDQCPADQLADLEHFWINELQWAGHFLYNGNSGVRGSAINELELKNAIKAFKKTKGKRRETPAPVTRVFDQQQYDYWKNNPQAFEKERLRRAELAKADAALRKKHKSETHC